MNVVSIWACILLLLILKHLKAREQKFIVFDQIAYVWMIVWNPRKCYSDTIVLSVSQALLDRCVCCIHM